MIARWIAGAFFMGPGSGKGSGTERAAMEPILKSGAAGQASKRAGTPRLFAPGLEREKPGSVRLLDLQRLDRLARAFVQHDQVARGQGGTAAGDRAFEIRPFADLEAAQPGRLDHRQQLAGAHRLLGRPVEQQVAEREEEV